MNESTCHCGSGKPEGNVSRKELRRLAGQLALLEERHQKLVELTKQLAAVAAPAAPAPARRSSDEPTRLAAAPALGGAAAAQGGAALVQELEALRIVGGVPSQPGAHEHCALLIIDMGGGQSALCTGVLVAPRVILSAAHCGGAVVGITAHLKCNSIQQARAGNAETIAAKSWKVHRDYAPHDRPAKNDIMLIILESASTVTPCPIARLNETNEAREVQLVGFGSASLNANAATTGVKREVNVPVISIRRATGDDLDTAESSFGYESDSEFVAGGQGFDTCQGDSGGPVYLDTVAEGARRVAGLTSRYALISGMAPGNPCGSGGVYTRIDSHLDWIKEQAGAHFG